MLLRADILQRDCFRGAFLALAFDARSEALWIVLTRGLFENWLEFPVGGLGNSMKIIDLLLGFLVDLNGYEIYAQALFIFVTARSYFLEKR